MLAVGPNGAGKTNLLESLHVGTQGFSPRTRADAQLIRFGESAGRIDLRGERGESVALEIDVVLRAGEAKRARLNGAVLRAAEQLRTEVATLVFTPDRLTVVKGPPAVRRAYFDRTLGRLFPARTAVSAQYGAAIAQRNAALRRVALGYSSREALEPWTERVAEVGAELVAARRATADLLAPALRACAAELGLEAAALRYEGDPPTADALRERLDRDLDRGTTGLGPHLHDFALASGDRDLRLYGSQGEQRLTVLALLLAEAELIRERTGMPPLLLLDDVLSELDPERRRALADRLAEGGQALITSTTAGALPRRPDQLLEVSPGRVTVVT